MDKLPTDIQYMIIKDLNPTSLLILIKQYPFIKDLVRDTMNILIKYYIEEYEYEGYLWRDNNTIDDFIENLKIRSSMEPINNDIINEVLAKNSYEHEHIQKIDDIRHLKMFSMLVKRLNINYDNCFYLNYRDYKDPEKYDQEDVNDRIHFMYIVIKRYPTFVELPEDTNMYHINNFDEIYDLDDNRFETFYATVDKYVSRGCHPYYIIDTFSFSREAFDYYLLTKKFSPKLSYRIACDFDGRTDVSDERLLEEYGWGDFDNDLQKEIKEYIRQKALNNN
jgi:hypothetical protein